jgi:hypothetical protein
MRYLTRTPPLCVIFLALTINLFAQCAGKTGFALQACQAIAGSVPATGAPADTSPPLATSFTDAIHTDLLPASMEPKAPLPLAGLERADDGAYILKAGVYEAYVEGYSLDADRRNGALGFYPAPFVGRRGAVIESILKLAELHPAIYQPDIQALLSAIVSGTDLENMPASVQQTATAILPPGTVAQLRGPSKAKAVKKAVLGELAKRLPGFPQSPAPQPIPKDTSTAKEYAAASVGFTSATPPIEKGSWVKMPGGFYVRYLSEDYAKVRLQLMVPPTLSGQPIKFDPTHYVAVALPSQRIGVTMRPVK